MGLSLDMFGVVRDAGSLFSVLIAESRFASDFNGSLFSTLLLYRFSRRWCLSFGISLSNFLQSNSGSRPSLIAFFVLIHSGMMASPIIESLDIQEDLFLLRQASGG
jgi:hypothetical protein